MSQSPPNPAGSTSTYPPSDQALAHTIDLRSEMLANFRFAADRDEAERQGRLWLLDFTSPIEGLNFWYLPPEGGSPAALLAFAHQTVPGIEGGTAGEFVALSQALPAEAILERRLMPVGDEARAALGTWMELHADSITPVSMDAALGTGDPAADQALDEVFLRHMEGWRVTIAENMPEMMDLTVPEGAAFDWNDVFDAMIAARNNWRPSAYLAVINCAVAIGTQAALEFIGNYSDDTSPAHEIAAQALARALGREDAWHAATVAGQREPAP